MDDRDKAFRELEQAVSDGEVLAHYRGEDMEIFDGEERSRCTYVWNSIATHNLEKIAADIDEYLEKAPPESFD